MDSKRNIAKCTGNSIWTASYLSSTWWKRHFFEIFLLFFLSSMKISNCVNSLAADISAMIIIQRMRAKTTQQQKSSANKQKQNKKATTTFGKIKNDKNAILDVTLT